MELAFIVFFSALLGITTKLLDIGWFSTSDGKFRFNPLGACINLLGVFIIVALAGYIW